LLQYRFTKSSIEYEGRENNKVEVERYYVYPIRPSDIQYLRYTMDTSSATRTQRLNWGKQVQDVLIHIAKIHLEQRPRSHNLSNNLTTKIHYTEYLFATISFFFCDWTERSMI